MKARILCLSTVLVLAAIPSAAQEASPVEAKLRETLRTTMTQLRAAEAERARLDAELAALKTDSAKEIAEWKQKFEEAAKVAKEEKSAADKLTAEQTAAIRKRDERLAQLVENLDKWKADHVRISEIARNKETERAKLEAKVSGMEHKVSDLERRNLELFRIGNEILVRYENFALGKALLAREPFTGITRVKLEEQVQDYKDKLTGQFAVSGGENPARP